MFSRSMVAKLKLKKLNEGHILTLRANSYPEFTDLIC